MSEWARILTVCALLASAILITIGVVSDIYRKERNRRVIRRRLQAPDPRCVVPNSREPL